MSDWQHKTRLRIEQAVGEALADAILTAGHGFALHDGEDFATIGDSRLVYDTEDKARGKELRKLIAKELRATDQDTLYLYEPDARTGRGPWRRIGSIFLVYGNDGTDVISDYSANPATEAIVGPIMAKLNKLDEEGLPCVI